MLDKWLVSHNCVFAGLQVLLDEEIVPAKQRDVVR